MSRPTASSIPGNPSCISRLSQDGVVRLAPKLNSNQLNKALEGVRGSKIITLKNAAEAFSEFSEADVGGGRRAVMLSG